MIIEVDKTQTKFEMGISVPEQVQNWLHAHPMMIGFAMIGRSNVGKSTLINSLFGKKTARVSNTPGRTRQINVFSFQLKGLGKEKPVTYALFDLPGYGHAEASKQMLKNWNFLMDTFFNALGARICLINIQDARHPGMESDLKCWDFIKKLDHEALLVYNKTDKLKNQSERAASQKAIMGLMKTFKKAKQIFFVSAEKGDGLKELETSMITFLLKKKLFIEHNSKQD